MTISDLSLLRAASLEKLPCCVDSRFNKVVGGDKVNRLVTKITMPLLVFLGGGGGIGKSTCGVFAREGARVIVADINEKLAQTSAEELPGN